MLSSPQPPEEGEEGNEGKGEEEWAAFVVDPMVDHMRALVDAQIADGKDTESIPNDGERNDEQDQGPAFPSRRQKELSGNNACNEQDEA